MSRSYVQTAASGSTYHMFTQQHTYTRIHMVLWISLSHVFVNQFVVVLNLRPLLGFLVPCVLCDVYWYSRPEQLLTIFVNEDKFFFV